MYYGSGSGSMAAAATAWDRLAANLYETVASCRAVTSKPAEESAGAAALAMGQASPMIADTDAEYERMWVNDAEDMYAYARASAGASALTPFSTPHLSIDPAESARQSAALTGSSWALTDAPDVITAGQQGNGSDPGRAASNIVITTDDVRCPSVVGDIVAVETEFAVPAVGRRD
jgi:PPE-repeat protein